MQVGISIQITKGSSKETVKKALEKWVTDLTDEDLDAFMEKINSGIKNFNFEGCEISVIEPLVMVDISKKTQRKNQGQSFKKSRSQGMKL